jgi:hypothetical protein
MMKFQHIVVHNLTGRNELVGASMGDSDRPLFEAAAQTGAAGSVIRFDWSGIMPATGSYLKAAYIPIFQRRRPALLLSSDMDETVAEDMQIVLENMGLSILVARRIPRRKQYDISVLGALDSTYWDTLAVIKERPYVTAGGLFAEEKSNIGKTAWMNRLSRLYEMGLLSKEKAGKEYRYSFPKLEVNSNG